MMVLNSAACVRRGTVAATDSLVITTSDEGDAPVYLQLTSSAGKVSQVIKFTFDAPLITSFEPPAAFPLDTVTVHGANFGVVQGQLPLPTIIFGATNSAGCSQF